MIIINSVNLIGRVARELDLRKTNSGRSVASFSLAVNRTSRNKDGEYEADFLTVVVWNQSADYLAQYAKKGTLVGVQGSLQTRTWDKPDGMRGYATEVVANHAQILAQPLSQGQQSQVQPSYQQQPSQQYQSTGNFQQPMQQQQSMNNFGFDGYSEGPTLDISSDDLPF